MSIKIDLIGKVDEENPAQAAAFAQADDLAEPAQMFKVAGARPPISHHARTPVARETAQAWNSRVRAVAACFGFSAFDSAIANSQGGAVRRWLTEATRTAFFAMQLSQQVLSGLQWRRCQYVAVEGSETAR